ncbi:MAG TPA: CapA family protein [Steroidobacteraceae bacterium]|nr:CapA family protein [Steroidobacteraceae bacterium]
MNTLDFVFAGDLILDYPNPDHWLSGIEPALHKADLAIGHLEVPHTNRSHELKGDVPAPGANPEYIAAIARAGFHAVSLAGNHIADCGGAGIADTIAELDRANMKHAGAAATLAAARQPAMLIRKGKRIALLSYNCVGPENSWASDTHAGCAYVRVETRDGSPIAPAAPLQQANATSLASMRRDIEDVRAHTDIVIVALHKGIVHTPAKLAPYEQPVAHAVIDAGCDIVIGHHAHIVRGIELYRGKPIFHGLGNGCVVTKALSPDQSHPERAAWARRRKELFGFEPDPAYELAPFHPEAINAMLGCVQLRDDVMRIGFVPVHVEPPGRPVLANRTQAERVTAYLEKITVAAGLASIKTTFDGECAWLN